MIVLAKLFLYLLSRLPEGGSYWLATHLSGAWMRFSPGKSRVAKKNLELCFPRLEPSQREQLLRDSFLHYASTILETGRNWYWPLTRLHSLSRTESGNDLLSKSPTDSRGVLILAPHCGAWEYLGIYLQMVTDMAILYKPPAHPGLGKALVEKRRRAGGHLIPATPAGLRQLYTHLRDGGNAGVLPDQQPSSGQGRFAPFFGNPALTGVMVPRLVQRTGCRVVFSVCERLAGGRYAIHTMPADDDLYSTDLDTALAAVNRGVEKCIAVAPAQYLWSYKRFRSQPPGAPSVY